LLVGAPGARAATAQVDEAGVVHYTAGPGEANDLTYDDVFPLFRDSGATIQAGPGCSVVEDGGVLCSTEQAYPELVISLGDQDDKLTDVYSDFGRVTVFAGDGADNVRVNPQFATVSGEAGNDVISASGNSMAGLQSGGDGDDTIVIGGAFGSIEGGPGDDVLSGGSTSAGDAGNDVIEMYYWDSGRASGGEGHDVIRIPCGTAFGDDGADLLLHPDPSNTESCPVSLHGGAGPDSLTGSALAGGDLLDGGAGDDVLDGLAGSDHLLGGSGADRLNSVDGEADVDECGSGRDFVIADKRRLDRVARDCETVRRSKPRV
jgi:Ca2+-binding RTX toxin-like protein